MEFVVISRNMESMPKKTTKFDAGGVDDEGNELLVEKDRDFFCSELVAKSYKVMGILKPQIQGRADAGVVSAQVKSALSG